MKIVCLGDSMTACPGVKKSERWTALLERETVHEWVCTGVPGDTTGGMLARLQAILSEKSDAVFLMGGVNDILVSGECSLAKAGMMALIHHCVAAGVRPIVGIPYRITRVPQEWKVLCGRGAMEALGLYIDWLRELCAVFHLRCVDFAAAFDGAEKAGLLQPDGLHPTAAGCRLMADAVMSTRGICPT